MTLDEFLKLPGAKVWPGGNDSPISGPVEVLYRSGDVDDHDFAQTEDWSHEPNDPHCDIIAYREVQP